VGDPLENYRKEDPGRRIDLVLISRGSTSGAAWVDARHIESKYEAVDDIMVHLFELLGTLQPVCRSCPACLLRIT
jgi:hypothetical protein